MAADPVNRRTQQAQERLLRAGLDVWSGLDAADALAAVSPRRVAQRAQRQIGALYHHWPRIDLFHRALLRWALRPDHHAHLDEAAADVARGGHDVPPTVAIAELARWSFERIVADQRATFRFTLFAGAIADGDPQAATALRESYDPILRRNASLFEELLGSWGRRVREPLTAEDLATVLAALNDGMALRHLFDPDAADVELFVAAVLAILPALTRPADSVVPLDGFVRQLLARPVDDDAIDDGRRRGGPAAVALYRDGGWDAVTVASVARRAHVEPLVLHRAFDGRDGLAAPVWASLLLPPLQAAGEVALQAGDGLEALVRFLRDLAAVAGAHRPVTTALLAGVQRATASGPPTAPTDPRRVVPIMDVPRRAAMAAFDAGVLDPDLVPDRETAADLGAFATNFLLLRFLTRPAEPAERTAELIERLVVAGLRART